jgi:hypothetical protein
MKAQIAAGIYRKIIYAIENSVDISTVFNHVNKVKAIKEVFNNRDKLYNDFKLINILNEELVLNFCYSLPHIGDITKYHMAKDLGCDVIKPDRHLVRISKKYGLTPFAMCQNLSNSTGDKLSAVDFILWRAANLGII